MSTASRLPSGLILAGLLMLASPGRQPGKPAEAPAAARLQARAGALDERLQAQAGTLDEHVYWQVIDLALRRLAEIQAGPPESAEQRLSSITLELQDLHRVSLEDGSTLPVAHGVLLALLTTDPPELEAAGRLLRRMQHAHQVWPAPRHGPQALEELAGVLSRSEFAWETPQPSRLSELLDSLRERLRDLWYGLLEPVVRVLGTNPALRWAIFAAGALALAWTAARAARRLFGGFVPETSPEDDRGEMGAPLTAGAALQLAQEMSQAGDYRSAARYLYLSSLISLEERGLLRHDRTRTNREYLRMLADHPDLADVLREVVEVFDRVWYGFHRLDGPSFARYAARVEQLRGRKS